MNKTKKIFFPLLIISLPIFADAEVLRGTKEIIQKSKGIIDLLIPIVFTLALLLFFWGVVKYIWSEGSGKGEGKQIMWWGVIAIFVMSSVWALVYFIGTNLGLDDYGYDAPSIPTFKK